MGAGVLSVAGPVVVALGNFHRAEATPAATRQEILDGCVACLEAKEHVPVIPASVELGALGAAATGAGPKLVKLGQESAPRRAGRGASETCDGASGPRLRCAPRSPR